MLPNILRKCSTRTKSILNNMKYSQHDLPWTICRSLSASSWSASLQCWPICKQAVTGTPQKTTLPVRWYVFRYPIYFLFVLKPEHSLLSFSVSLIRYNSSRSASYTGCHRRNEPNFGRVFLMLNYTDITQNTYVQSWTVSEIMASKVWNFDSCYTLTDYQILIETGRNMWFQ